MRRKNIVHIFLGALILQGVFIGEKLKGQTFKHDFVKKYTASTTNALRQTRDIETLGNGGYVTVGDHESSRFNATDKILFKMYDQAFNLRLTKTYALPSEIDDPSSAYSNISSSDITPIDGGSEGFIICGSFIAEGAPSNSGPYLMKIGPHGDFDWFKLFPNYDEFSAVTITHDNKILVCGKRQSSSNNRDYAIYMKTDLSGNPIFSGASITPEGDATYSDIEKYKNPNTGDINYVLIGTAALMNKWDIALTRLDQNLQVIKDKTYGINLDKNGNLVWESGFGVEFNPNNGKIYISGSVRNGNCSNGKLSFMLSQFDPDLTYNWSKQYRRNGGGKERGLDLAVTSNQVFITGETDDQTAILETDLNGNLQKFELFSDLFVSSSITRNSNGHVVATGKDDKTTTTSYLIEHYVSKTNTCEEEPLAINEFSTDLPKEDMETDIIHEINEKDKELPSAPVRGSSNIICDKIEVQPKKSLSNSEVSQENEINKKRLNRNVYKFELENGKQSDYSYKLFSAKGKVVEQGNNISSNPVLNLNSYHNGVYFLSIKSLNSGEFETFKLLKN